MKNIIVGTAGHIDHGKTALVRALTGIDTDRLEEEKRRGISIDIGFAHLQLAADVRAGFVDVPGHERFVKNMLAGVGGIDLVLLVIAADESIMPQTREHFEICRLLGIRRGAVVITKTDLVESDVADLVRLEAEEFVAGSFLEGAPMIGVSSTTGEGLEVLRKTLLELARTSEAKDSSRHFRLPVDRAFSIHGFGTVLTGTLVSGSVKREDEIELHPGHRRSRVRGVQVHGETADCALAGQRTALNVTGIEPSEVVRGMTATAPGVFQAVDRVDCRLELLRSAKPLKQRAPVHFHSGTAEVEAEVRPLEGAAAEPGSTTYARIVLREPLLLLPGDRFIVRMFSPVVTIGGGVVLDIAGHRYRKDENPRARLEVLQSGTPEDRIALLVRESPHGMGIPELIAATGLLRSEIERGAAGLFTIREPQFWLVDERRAEDARAGARNALATYHKANPLSEGMPKEALRNELLPHAPAFLLDALLAGDPGIVTRGEAVRTASHRVVLKQEEEQATAAMEAVFAKAGLAVPSLAEAMAKSGVEAARARSLLQMLLKQGTLVKVADDLVFHRFALEGLKTLLAPHKGRKISVPEFKDLAGISRKYAIPLLEYLDRTRVTRREGDQRVVL